MTGYDLEVDRIVAEVRKSKAKRVGLQFPEGLKEKALDIAREIEASTEATVVVMADPTYGACDIKSDQAKKLGIGLLVHFGHTEF
jgi:2-(3-amino-3-carboxypropyl)histidine synthase